MPTNNPRYMREYVRRLRLSLIKQLGGKCTKCGENDPANLFFHHVNGYKGKNGKNHTRGGMQQLYDVKRLIEGGHEHEVEMRCYKHHKWFKER